MNNPNTETTLSDFITPRYWPTWIGIGILRLCICLPFRWQQTLGAIIGQLGYYLAKSRRKITATNIRLCFPELSPAEQKDLTIKTFRSTGKAIFETGLSWWGNERKLDNLCQIEGLENLQQALKQKKGVILLSAHFTSLEIGGRLLSLHQPFQVVYKKAHNPLFELFMQRAREKHYQRAIQTYDLRGMLKGLKENKVSWYASDQDFGTKQSIFVPFMGVTATTLTTPARLAKMSGAPVVPYFPRRLENGKGYQLTILPILEGFPCSDEYKDAERINQIIEA
ncbi:MAG: lipid A biosynthesis acyltransferase, partial [Gammaproteobacteria bacterium]|nr:lipid A biosynthesis acyltransferase [Gammaproteobacteria bacterium]